MINLGQLLGNAFHGAQQAVGNFFHPQPHPQQPQQPNLAQFLQQHIGQAAQQSVRQAPTVIRSINNNPIVRNIENIPNATSKVVGGSALHLAHTVNNLPQGKLGDVLIGGTAADRKRMGMNTVGDFLQAIPGEGQGLAAVRNGVKMAGTTPALANDALKSIKLNAQRVAGGVNSAIKPLKSEAGYIRLPGESSQAAADRFIAGAQADKPHFIGSVKGAADAVGGSVPAKAEANAVKGISSSGVKDTTRMVAKIEKKGQITDPLRSTIVAHDPNAAPAVIDHMRKQGYELWTNPKTGQPDFTNRHIGRQAGDYTDIAMKFVKHQGDPIVKELQLIQPNMHIAKATGHTHYEAQQAAEGLLAKTTDPTTKVALQGAIDHHVAQQQSLYEKAYGLDNPPRSTASPIVASESKSLAPNGTPNLANTALRSATEVPPKNLTPTSASRNLSLDTGIVPPSDLTVAHSGANVNKTVTQAPIVGPKIVPNKFTESARTSPELSAETQGIVDGTHDIKSNKILVAGQGDLLKRGLKKATASVDSAMAKPPGKISDQDVANAIAVAKAHDAKGNFEDSARILNDLSDHLVHSGRAVQAASLLERISPQGRLYAAQKQLKKAGVELTPELKGKLKEAIDNIKSFPEGSTERAYAGQQLIHFVQKQIPSSKVDKVIGIWKAGLLTGMRTQTGNMVGNAGNLAIKKAADAVAAPIDKAFSVFTGQRTKTFTLKGLGSGAAEGTKAAGKFLKTGVDERNLENLKYDHAALNYKNPALNAYVNGVFKLMGAADRPAYYSAQKNALYDLAKADGLNQGLKGSALKAHIGELVKNPTDEMAQSAVDTAEKTVFANDTLLSKIAGGIRTGASKSPLGRAAINVVMPFTKVPSSVITQVFDYTPTGAVKEIISQASKGKFDQRSMTEALGKATVGTVGVISTGIALTNAGIMTGAYPKDPKEQALWKAEGKQPNSILVAGKWRSLNYLAPYGPLLGMGQNIAQASKDGLGALGGIASAVGSGVQTALGQSFLQGVQGVLDAVNDPTRYGLSTAKNMASSVIPTLVGDVAKATDGLQRQTNSIGQAIAAKIPGLREALLPQQDTLGNQIANNNSAGTTMLDPTRPTKNVTNPLFSELDRLMGTKNGVFPVNDKTIGSGKTAIKLTPEQVNQRQQQVGQIVTPLWNQIIADPKYATLDDPHKKDALQRVLTDAQTAVDRQLTTQIDPSKLTKPATGVTASILSGKGPTAQSYLNKASGAATDPASKYQTDLAKYKDDKASGKLTGPKDLAAQAKLQKEAITSKYSQDVLDFYALSKAQKNAYFKSDPQTAKSLYDQAKQLDGELTGKTGATTKFKYGLGSKPKKGRVAKITKATRTASTRINKSKVKIPKIAFAKPKPLKLAKITRSKASSGKKTTLTA